MKVFNYQNLLISKNLKCILLFSLFLIANVFLIPLNELNAEGKTDNKPKSTTNKIKKDSIVLNTKQPEIGKETPETPVLSPKGNEILIVNPKESDKTKPVPSKNSAPEKEKLPKRKPITDEDLGIKKSKEEQKTAVKLDSMDFAIMIYESYLLESDSIDKIITALEKGNASHEIEMSRLKRQIRLEKEEMNDSLKKPISKPNNKKSQKENRKQTASTEKKGELILIDSMERKMESLKKLIESNEHTKSDLIVSREKYAPKLSKQSLNIQRHAQKIMGSKIVTFRNQRYAFFVSDLDSNDVRLHWKNPKGKKHIAMESVKNELNGKKITPLMICNAGMYNSDNSPKGLYIEGGKELIPADTFNPKNGDNFYLMPNGVFYITKDNVAHIDTSELFMKQYISKKLSPVLATQSGPMLVINDKIHRMFGKGSRNYNIRNGVGVMNNTNSKKVVFCISIDRVNFYDFATAYKDFFGCKNALFLDGAISRMYLSDLNPREVGGGFGPIFSVSKKPTIPKK